MEKTNNKSDEKRIKMLDICRKYYENFGKEMISQKFPEYENKIAVGLCGEGSECFGFEDQISLDHDCGPGFAMWIDDSTFDAIGNDLQKAYVELPDEFMGYKRINTSYGSNRCGVSRINDYYRRVLGGYDFDINGDINWYRLNEDILATATNGEIFVDAEGVFTAKRNRLLEYYPDNIWLEKLARSLILSAQSGQYNYPRLMARGEYVAARIALSEYMKNTMHAIFFINRKYSPYYKWQRRALSQLPALSELGEYFDAICELPLEKEAWEGKIYSQTLNADDRIVLIIETVAQKISEKLNEMGLSSSTDRYLETQGMQVASHIK